MENQNNVIQFKKVEKANSEPIVESDYFGYETFPLLELLQALERNKGESK